jgi:hypothetical protein
MAKNCFVPLLYMVTLKLPLRLPEISRITELINCNITKWGIGQWAMGNGQWELKKFFESNARYDTIFFHARCPMPNALN